MYNNQPHWENKDKGKDKDKDKDKDKVEN